MSSFMNSEQYAARSVPSTSEVESTMGGAGIMHPQSGMENPREFAKGKYAAAKHKKDVEKHKQQSEKLKSSAKFPLVKGKKSKMNPQSGISRYICQNIIMNCDKYDLSLPPAIMNKMENAIALLVSLQQCTSAEAACASIFLYVKTHTSISVSETVFGYITKILSETATPQSGEIYPSWLQAIKQLQVNWGLAVGNVGFKRVSELISMCLSLGLCDVAQLPVSLGGMQAFSSQNLDKHVTAFDLVDAVIKTVVHFIEGGYMCFKKRSLSPLLYGDIDNQRFRELYERCMRCQEYYPAGNLRRIEGLDDNDYAALLVECLEKGVQTMRSCATSFEKNIVERYCDNVRRWQATFFQTRAHGGLRVAPYAIGLYGGTGVGKSSLASILMVTTLMANEYDASDERIVTHNDDDKYFSNMRTDINGVFLDDVGNTKAAFVERAPSKTIIQLMNNIRSYANRAEVEMKGKVSIEPKVCLLTKNVKDGGAHTYSNEPASILRRERITITVVPKKEFRTQGMLCGDKLDAYFADGIPVIPDIWDLTVEKSYPITNPVYGRPATVGWELVQDDDGKPLQKVSVQTVVRWIAKDSAKYFQQQTALVENGKDMSTRLEMCPYCRTPKGLVCICPTVSEQPEQMTQQSLDLSSAFNTYYVYTTMWYGWMRIYSFLFREEDEGVVAQVERARLLHQMFIMRVLTIFPSSWFDNRNFYNAVFAAARPGMANPCDAYYAWHMVCIVFSLACAWCDKRYFLLTVYSIVQYCRMLVVERNRLFTQISLSRAQIPAVLQAIRDGHVAYIKRLSATLGILYLAIQVYKRVRNAVSSPIMKLAAQGLLSPLSDADIKERDGETNPWCKIPVSTIPAHPKVKTTTMNQLEQIVFNNLCHVTVMVGETKSYSTDAFFPCSNVVIIPTHVLKGGENLACKFVRNEFVGSSFIHIISLAHSEPIPGTDFTLVWVPSGGDWKDVRAYFPTTKFKSGPGKLVYKDEKGDPHLSGLYHYVGQQDNSASRFYGSRYELEFPTFRGLCMAVTLVEQKFPTIAGFHLGGFDGTKVGCSGFLSYDQINKGVEALSRKPGVMLCANTGTLRTEVMGVQFFEGRRIHTKSPLNFLTSDPLVTAYGSVIGRAKYYSTVEQTVISPTVTAIMGVPQKWGKPKFGSNYPWQASLEVMSHPSTGVEGTHLSWSVLDYKNGFMHTLVQFPELMRSIRPLTREETVNGKIATRFIDKMVSGTSIGYPLTGPKENYQHEVVSPEDERRQDCVDFEEYIWDEFEYMEQEYVEGRRCYPVFKACLKDEPTPLDKDKVRVFQAAPVSLQLLVRKYFLPVVRAMSMLPLASECAVGVNAHSREWEQLSSRITQYGSERILAGDYSKYDLRMPSQLVLAAFSVIVDIAAKCGYSARDLSVMKGVATDIAYPVMAYNGDLISLYASNPSGHNLTVYINCIVNSLLLRCAYYHVEGPEYPFRDRVAMITYGDDCKGSVSTECEHYNHIAVAKYLSDRGMVFTMPDKEATPRPFMHDNEADFLKRFSVYHEKLNCTLGALDSDSIYKCLHAVLKSSFLSPRQQAMANLETAAAEWFVHGEAVYETKRQQLLAIARIHEMDHGCPSLRLTYDDRVAQWKERYPDDSPG